MKKIYFSFIILLIALILKAEDESKLKIIDSIGKQIIFNGAELLARSDCEDLLFKIGTDPAYPDREMHYKAIKVSNLVKDITVDKDDLLAFEATDGFSAPLLSNSSDIALGRKKTNGPQAYIAIENEKTPWPNLETVKNGKHKGTAGPFYLVWINADKNIGSEEWAFKLSKLKLLPSIEKQYPKLVPKNSKINSIELQGFHIFLKTCFACHSLNLEGENKKGPDLNIPESPLDYFGEKRLLKFIRDPQTVRKWNKGQMPSFNTENLGEDELKKIIFYLNYMRKNRY